MDTNVNPFSLLIVASAANGILLYCWYQYRSNAFRWQFSAIAPGLAPPISPVINLPNFNALVGERLIEYGEREVNAILDALETEHLYLDQRLTLDSLARTTRIPKRKLSFVINDHFGKNFNELVNAYRVKAVQKKLLDPAYANYSILGIALDCGFNSKSSFNRIFKKQCGQTPLAFMEENREQDY